MTRLPVPRKAAPVGTPSIPHREPPAEGTFKVATTRVDGRPRAFLLCARCDWYSMYVSSHIGGGVGEFFPSRNLGDLLTDAAGHRCPPEVRDAARR
jgi:hypothetical protein